MKSCLDEARVLCCKESGVRKDVLGRGIIHSDPCTVQQGALLATMREAHLDIDPLGTPSFGIELVFKSPTMGWHQMKPITIIT